MAMTMDVNDFLLIINSEKDIESFIVVIDDNNKSIYHESENFKKFIY